MTARPRVRADCEHGPRPCPWERCRYILPDGSCALDMAERGGMTLQEVGAVLGVTRERVRQIEVAALSKVGLALWRLGVLPRPPERHPRGKRPRPAPAPKREAEPPDYFTREERRRMERAFKALFPERLRFVRVPRPQADWSAIREWRENHNAKLGSLERAEGLPGGE